MTTPVQLVAPLDPSTTPQPIFMRYIKLTVTTGSGATLKTHSFECQVTNAGITSTGGDAQSITTLCPDGTYSESTERIYSVTITGIQDVTTQESLMLFLWEHDGELAEIVFFPRVTKSGTPEGRGWKGSVKLVPPDTIGGADSGTYATFTASLPFQSKPVMIDKDGVVVNPPTPTGAVPGVPGSFTPTGANTASLTSLQALGSLGQGAAWQTWEYVTLIDASSARWTGSAWAVFTPPTKGVAAPSNHYPAEPTVTAEDATNAAKLTGLGYVASPLTAWTTGQAIFIGSYKFNWSSTAWAAGAHA